MKWPFYIFVFQAFLFPVAGQTLSSLPTDTNTISYKVHNGGTVALSVRHLFYKDKDGFTDSTEDAYILEVINGDQPRIVDRINGVQVSFQLANIGGTNDPKLLVFYHAGGNAYCVKIYRLDGIEIIPFKTQPVCSNMGSIRLKGENIIIENQEINIDDTTTFYTDTYQVVGDECKLLKGEKKVLPRATNN